MTAGQPVKLSPTGEPVECWHLHVDADRMVCVECGCPVRVARMLDARHAEVKPR